MELTLDQALQKGIEAHKAGQVEEADRYYTAILKTNPKHPDANHNMGVLAVGVGKVTEALPFFKTALEANPSITQYWLSYIDALIKLDRMADAKAVFDQAKSKSATGDSFDQLDQKLNALVLTSKNGALEEEPPEVKVQPVVNLYKQGQFEEAVSEASKLLKDFPNSVTLYNIIGAANKSLGKLDEAIEAYKTAISIKPDYAEAYNNMGATLKEQWKLDEAIKAYKTAISIKPDYYVAYFNIGNTLKDQGRFDSAIQAYKNALAVKPDYVEAEINLTNVKRLAVPDWHIPMMNEDFRNNAYQKAIRSAVQDGDLVLDIGTGAGLLSMIAADCGAKKVISCEVSSTISRIAQQIIQKNGFDDKIKLINKHSKNIKLGQDINSKADILVSEILSSEFVGEGIQTSILDAKKRLLKKNGKMIPQAGSIMVALIENTGKLAKELFVDNALGYDIGDFNALAANKWFITLEDEPVLLSDPIEAFTFDFCNFETIYLDKRKFDMKITKTGSCAGVIQWLKVNLFEDIEYQNNPVAMYQAATVSGWKTPIYKFDTPLNVTKGASLNIQGTLSKDHCWFNLDSS